jgi:hypothetical protein
MLELDQGNSGLRILDVSRCGPTSAALPALDIEASEYRELESAFRQRGGLVESETLTELLRTRMDQPISRLSRWIVDRDVLSLTWSSRMMVPLFQFDPFSLLPHPAVGEVTRELAPVLGDWSLALWLVRPHALLGCLAPVVAFQHHAPAVVDAARAQRYLVCG